MTSEREQPQVTNQRGEKLVRPLVITPGEPAGIGPDLILMLATERDLPPLVVMADKTLLAERAAQLGINVNLVDWSGTFPEGVSQGRLIVQNVDLTVPSMPGQLDAQNAQYVLACLNNAIDGCVDGVFSALVTGPLHKGIINEAGIPFSGHTEHLQFRCGVEKVVMMLASPRMRVALATTHLPLAQVAESITRANLTEVLSILIDDLQSKFGIQCPNILVAGLNPHAGEGGHMGAEEIDTIIPVLKAFESAKANITGPLPADTLFTKKYLDEADAVLAMYHDQGLPVLKYDGFGESVNITLGLPIIRTSVDHGTALDLTATGNIDTGSLKTAINVALEMATSAKSSDIT